MYKRQAMSFGDRSHRERLLKITIPENLYYDGLFDDIFRQYTSSHTLERVKDVYKRQALSNGIGDEVLQVSRLRYLHEQPAGFGIGLDGDGGVLGDGVAGNHLVVCGLSLIHI